VLCIIVIVCISQKDWLYRAWNMLRIAIFPVTHLDQPDDVAAEGNDISAPLHQGSHHLIPEEGHLPS
jgi:hypothetical protein